MTASEKIREILKIKELTPSKAERIIGVSVGTLSKAMERGGNIHESTLNKFLRNFHVKQSWWETGTGEIFEEKPTFEGKAEEPQGNYKAENELLRKYNRTLELLVECQREKEELKKENDVLKNFPRHPEKV